MPQPIIFISYSRKDEPEKDALLTHLRGLQREGLIKTWHDNVVGPGEDWAHAIDTAMAQAKIAILLVTANFLDSEFILEKEIPVLMDRRENEGLVIYPVIAKACAWKSIGWLKQMNIRPKNGRPVWADGGSHVNEDLAAIAEEVAHLVSQLNHQPETSSPTSPSPGPSRLPPNPFGDTGRITDPTRFFDREELLRQIFEELNKGSNLSLVGESQVGKSSLMSMICALGPERSNLPAEEFVYLTLEWVDNEDEFYEALCDVLKIETCRGFKMTRALQGKNIVLCVDEMEKMKWDGFTKHLRSHLRGLADGNKAPLKLVIASRSPLARLFPDSPELDSPLAGICRQVDVEPFTPETAQAFLHHRLQNTNVTFTPAEIDTLLSQTNGHPAHLQHAAADLYQSHASRLTPHASRFTPHARRP